MAEVEPPAANVELVGPADVAAVEGPAADSIAGPVRRVAAREEPPAEVAAALGTNVLRVVIEGISEEDARRAEVTTVAAWGEREERIEGSWLCQGLTSEFDLDPIFASAADRDLRIGSLRVDVDHPLQPPREDMVGRRGVGERPDRLRGSGDVDRYGFLARAHVERARRKKRGSTSKAWSSIASRPIG